MPSPSEAATVADSAAGFSFERPATWARWQPNEHYPMNDGPLVYLSTDPLTPSCATRPGATPHPANGQGRACDWPLTRLAPNGVLVTWMTTRILQPLPTAGEVVPVNGATSHLEVTRPGCGDIGADEMMYLAVPIGLQRAWSNVGVFACLRGPDLALAEAQVRAMLKSAVLVGP